MKFVISRTDYVIMTEKISYFL